MAILVTGGTGTLGQALVRLLMQGRADRICILSRDEYKQWEMREAIPDPDKRLRFFLGDVRDVDCLRMAFRGIQCVIHAAALKQVDAAERNPFEFVQTNIQGARNVILAALDAGVPRTLAISTDKAASPSTLYGATKLCAERLFIASNAYAGERPVRFSVIRLGNIAFSRGSVIPKWQSLLQAGATEVPVTDPDCTRYWITATDAAQAVLDALSAMQGGECTTPAMPAYRVADLAQALGARMRVHGLGAGERLHEDGSDVARRLSVDELRAQL
jgi:UDP-N-acetylglucosamine 4,6-dehydratase